jgi:dnd system-associated protein 4
MYEDTTWPDRIYIEEKYHPMYLELLGKGESHKVPFKTLKEIFMYAVALGVLADDKKPIEKKKELIFEKYLDSKMDKPILQCIYFLEEGNDDSIVDKKGAIELAQQYANVGFEKLYEVVTMGHDMIKTLSHYIIKEHIDESVGENVD